MARTLGEWRRLASLFFGEESGATAWLDQKIKDSPNGKDEEVLAPESQVINLLAAKDGGF